MTSITDEAPSISTSKVTSLPGHQPLVRPPPLSVRPSHPSVRPTPPAVRNTPPLVRPSPPTSRASNQTGHTANSRRNAASLLAMEETSKFPSAGGSNGVRCNIPECNKLFRNATLLLQHVKHYHSEVAVHLEEYVGNSPTVTDLAYLRTRVGDCKQEFESELYLLESIRKAKEKFDRKRRLNSSDKCTPKSSRSRLSRRTGTTRSRSTPSAD